MLSKLTSYDIYWLTGGLAGVVMLIVFFGWMHPENKITGGLDSKEIEEIALDVIYSNFNLQPEKEVNTNLRKNASRVEGFVQDSGKSRLRRAINEHDDFLFYWWNIELSSSFSQAGLTSFSNLQIGDQELSSIIDRDSFGGNTSERDSDTDQNFNLSLTLSRAGDLITFSADSVLVPANTPIEQNDDFFKERAQEFITSTIWGNFEPISVFVGYHTNDSDHPHTARVKYKYLFFDKEVTASVSMNHDREINRLSYTVENDFSNRETGQNVISAVQGFIIFIIVIILIGVFLRRLYLRLIDLKLVRPESLFLALLVAVTVFFGSVDGVYQNVEEPLLLVLFIIALIPIGSAIGTFFLSVPAFATIDSLAQEVWPRKKHTITLLRHGFIKNSLVGTSLIRGISAGLIVTGIFAFIFGVYGRAWYSVANDDIVMSGQVLMPFLVINFNTLILSVVVALLLVAFPASWLKSKSLHPQILWGTILLILALNANVLPDTGNSYINFIFSVLLMALPLYMFFKHDVLSLVVALFISGLSVTTTLAFITPGTADMPIFLTGMLMLSGLLIIGLVGASQTDDLSSLPDLVPEYIKKMAREQRIEKEIELAREVHSSFLSSAKPKIKGFDVAANCKTAYEVGGDYYDFIPLSDSKTLVIIADVSGKGVKAAFYMTLLKGYLQSMAEHYKQPDEILKQANRLFYDNSPRGTFITALAAVVDSETGKISFVRAGHDPLIVLNSSNKPTVYKPKGFALGMAKQAVFDKHIELETIDMKVGETAILFTDGYPESFNFSRKQLGDDGFINILLNKLNESSTSIDLLNSVQQEVLRFSAHAQQHDDMTMIVIKRTN